MNLADWIMVINASISLTQKLLNTATKELSDEELKTLISQTQLAHQELQDLLNKKD